MSEEVRPAYYKGQDGKDLFERFEEGLMTPEETIGFYKGCVIKYLVREDNKNGKKDLDKAATYLNLLEDFKYPQNSSDDKGTTAGSEAGDKAETVINEDK
ncbi:DUF3310 domain-containing protein [Secundilactobacillus kimchicus]|uniref:DUF3310 domain-containing protein n=1 Tax=Secundilactobacillus kimchicus TaxID=528209 RepID=UPI001C00C573|nr:DUF3310 domain-containing protein [Secundilactobacillus kimchicus]MBT9670459.1 DUF3310 domain-containing protein [Secundilactobacillus kimchicus]